MPTLNLGRVRFNWKGPYDPLVAYLKYDVVEQDGQSFVCIADVTGTAPLDTGGATYWDGALLRSADYNAARDQAVQAASDADASATAAATSEGNAATSEAAADATLATFQGQYWGASAAEPANDPNGNPPNAGDLYFNTSQGRMKVYDGAAALWRDAGSSVEGFYDRRDYVATEAQTTFAATYDPPFVEVLVNGALVPPSDYTATSGTDVVLNVGVPLFTEVTLIGVAAFTIADTYSQLAADQRFAQLAGTNDFTAMPLVGGDPIVESGSNSDGEWTRWAEGTQLVWSYNIGSQGAGTAFGSIYGSADTISWATPATFTNIQSAVASVRTSQRWAACAISGFDVVTRQYSHTLTTGLVETHAAAYGRWK